MVYSVLILWVLYAYFEGKREAIFWHHRVKSSDYEKFKSIDRHPMFVLQRGLVFIMGGITLYYISNNFLLTSYILVMNMLLFSFFHNGAMYTERNNMSNTTYTKRWFDQSSTSTAMMTEFMSPVSRTIQAVIGLIGYIVYPFL